MLSFVFVAQYGFAINFVNAISPRNAERPKRKQTKYIILHTTEASDKSSLASLKRYGEAHYMVSTGGTVYRIIDRNRVAYHAGVSMWEGKTHLDNYSIGIETVGCHNKSITSAQYTALAGLIRELQGIYKISDKNVLTHSMIAYGVPNKWHKKNHRGRKRCGMQFANDDVRYRLGLTDRYLYDPDVRAGRLTIGDQYLYNILYAKPSSSSHFSPVVNVDELSGQYEIHVVSKGQSPWDTVGLQSKLPETIYILPDGKKCYAKDIDNWSKIPVGTKILVKKGSVSSEKQFVSDKKIVSKKRSEAKKEKVKTSPTVVSFHGCYDTNTVVKGKSPWDIVGYKCKSDGTIYVFPDGQKCMATDIKDWNKIPIGTQIMVPKEKDAIDIKNEAKVVDDDVVSADIVNDEVVQMVTDVLTNAVVQEQVDIIIDKAMAVYSNYTFTDAVSENKVSFYAEDLLSPTTLFLISTGVQQGSEMSLEDLSYLKSDTKVLIGYEEKGILGGQKSAFDLVSYHWNQKDTVYYLPSKNTVITGDDIDERLMLKGTHLLLKKEQ